MLEDKRNYFETSTQSLLKKLDEMKLDKMSRIRAKSFTRAIRDAMTKPYVQTQTFNIPFPDECGLCYDSLGFCRVSSLSFINLMSEKGKLSEDWDLYIIDSKYGTHHFLKHKPDGIIFDLTFDQFAVEGIQVPYKLGKQTFVGLSEFNDPVHDFYNAAGFNKLKPLDLPIITFKDR